jgi:sugar lactone lactonase YvrE
MVADGGPGVVSVTPSTGRIRQGPRVPEVNGIADGLGRLWLTGGDAEHNHVLYAISPATSHVEATVYLPSRLVINPDDIAVGDGSAWVATGADVYRTEPGQAPSGAAAARAFAALPQGGLIGDVAVDAGGLWATDTTNGRVYRFAVSTGRLDAVIPVGITAGAMAVGDGGIWVANDDAHTVSRINTADNRVDSVVTIPGVPSHIAASDSGLWVTDGTGSVVTVPAGEPHRLVRVQVGGQLTGLAAAGETVWVADTAHGTLYRIDARRRVVVGLVPVGARPYAVAVDRQTVWVALLGKSVMHPSAPSQSSSTAGLLGWLKRVCGVK